MLALASAPVRGQDAQDDLRKGDESLATGLWEIAAYHYELGLQNAKLKPEQTASAAIGLAEAWIRAGKSSKALELLDQSLVRNHPEQAFWKGQALAASGRIADAITQLAPLIEKPDAPHRFETAVSLANLQLSLGQTNAALATLASLQNSINPSQAAELLLREVEILIDTKQIDAARKRLASIESYPEKLQARAKLLNAHLKLAENQQSAAAEIFKSLIDQPQGLTLRQFHSAALGLTDALSASEGPTAALTFMISFIGDHPNSPQLAAFFQRIEKMLPEKPLMDDPILVQLEPWTKLGEIDPTGLVSTEEAASEAAWPSAKPREAVVAHAIYVRALALDRNGSTAALAESRRLCNRLRAEFSDHPAADRALLMMAKRQLSAGAVDQAMHTLTVLRENSNLSSQRGEAAFLEAMESYKKGDAGSAAKLFDVAAQELEDENSVSARFNSLVAMSMDEKQSATSFTTIANIEDPALSEDLKLERAMAAKSSPEKTQALAEFISNNPQHPRVNEARIASAHAALDQSPPDTARAQSALDELAKLAGTEQAVAPVQLAWLKLRISSASNDLPSVIANANAMLTEFPTDPLAGDAALLLGRAHFESRSYNDARLVFEKLAATSTDSSRAQAAWLLAAQSAALVQTPQSRQEALILFKKAPETDSPLASVAKLEMARLMIDMNQAEDAVNLLRPWFSSLQKNDPIHQTCGLLLGDALQTLSLAQPEALTDALEIYDLLLVGIDHQSPHHSRLQYLRGRILEQLPDKPQSPGENEQQALRAYHSVLETDQAPADWNYFELCGFRALALCEKHQRWPAAIACARKIASFNGPRAEEAKQRAEQIRLKNMIWED
ncbi:MAG: tetratricopeptide repeat protein [Luteolibacter sp.]